MIGSIEEKEVLMKGKGKWFNKKKGTALLS
jgi:hypothetical protein